MPSLTTLKLLGATYAVEAADGVMLDGWGQVDFEQLKIFLHRNLCEQVAGQTLLHELLHIADVMTGSNHNRLTEEAISRTAAALWSFFQTEPKLFSMIWPDTPKEVPF